MKIRCWSMFHFQKTNSKMLKKRGYNTENTPYVLGQVPFFSFLSLCPICNKKSTHQSLRIQGCRFGPESSRQTLVSPIFRSLGTICGG